MSHLSSTSAWVLRLLPSFPAPRRSKHPSILPPTSSHHAASTVASARLSVPHPLPSSPTSRDHKHPSARAAAPAVTPPQLLALLLLLLTAAPAPLQAASDGSSGDGGFKTGRATFYGALWEPNWTIHHGSCGYGYLDPKSCTGWDVAALSDHHPDYAGGSRCGACYELLCNPVDFTDGYGAELKRSGACKDSSASVVVTITDSCPCNYANNAASNKRWCCGDMPHLDLSLWAFEKLADVKFGVIGIKYRQVPCTQRPSRQASAVPPAPGYPYPKGFQGDKRSCGGLQSMSKDAATTDMNSLGGQGGGGGAAAAGVGGGDGGGGGGSRGSSGNSSSSERIGSWINNISRSSGSTSTTANSSIRTTANGNSTTTANSNSGNGTNHNSSSVTNSTLLSNRSSGSSWPSSLPIPALAAYG